LSRRDKVIRENSLLTSREKLFYIGYRHRFADRKRKQSDTITDCFLFFNKFFLDTCPV